MLGALIGAAGSIAGGLFSGNAAAKAAKETARAQRYAADLQQKRFEEVSGYSKPFISAGQNALGMYGDYLGMNGTDAQSGAFANFQSSPYLQQMIKNAGDATSAQYAAHGSTGGNLLNALYKQNASLWNQDFQGYLDRLNGVSSTGLSAANALAGVGTQSAANQGNLISQAGQSQGAGTMGWGNAVGNALNNAGIWGMLGNAGNSWGTQAAGGSAGGTA